jgi:hypothetical protein
MLFGSVRDSGGITRPERTRGKYSRGSLTSSIWPGGRPSRRGDAPHCQGCRELSNIGSLAPGSNGFGGAPQRPQRSIQRNPRCRSREQDQVGKMRAIFSTTLPLGAIVGQPMPGHVVQSAVLVGKHPADLLQPRRGFLAVRAARRLGVVASVSSCRSPRQGLQYSNPQRGQRAHRGKRCAGTGTPSTMPFGPSFASGGRRRSPRSICIACRSSCTRSMISPPGCR